MKTIRPTSNSSVLARMGSAAGRKRWLATAAIFLALGFPVLARARTEWFATVGAQSVNKAHQALAFLPNEMWIHRGDKITWKFDSDEINTVTFLTPGQTRPFFGDGLPGFTASPATFNGRDAVTSPPMVTGQKYSVIFPAVGNFKLVCLVHEDQTGTIHVLERSAALPHDQAFYDAQGEKQRHQLLAESRSLPMDGGNQPGCVMAGAGAITVTGGGANSVSVMRFTDGKIEIRAGQTVEWRNLDPRLPHTVSFGTEPMNLNPPSPDVTVDPDGALHATLASPAGTTYSGFLVAAPEDRIGLAQSPLGTTRFRVTFPNAGTYPYVCSLHDQLGMVGTVVVDP